MDTEPSPTEEGKGPERPWGGIPRPALRMAVGLGDPLREGDLVRGLIDSGEFVLAARCLSGDQLQECIARGQADVALVSPDLHRLTAATLADLDHSRFPLVLLIPGPRDGRWDALPGMLLSWDTGLNTVRQSLTAAYRGETSPAGPREPAKAPPPPPKPAQTGEPAGCVIAVASGPGSPGRTTVALNIGAALGAVAPSVVVDTDLAGPSLAAWLDADPTRNLAMLAHAGPDTTRDWERAIAQEVQPLDPRSPHGVVLCGVPKAAMRGSITPGFLRQAVLALSESHRYVVLDLGADLLGAEVGLHRTALELARYVLVVANADLVGLWHAQRTVGTLRAMLGVPQERIALVINRHDRRHHHTRQEIEWALGAPTAALIPYDHGRVQRALREQRPVVLDGRCVAGRALLDLAERLHGGDVVLPPEPGTVKRRPWSWLKARLARKVNAGNSTEVPDGRRAALVR